MSQDKPEYLVVDEDDRTRRYLATTLHRSGCRVTTAADPVEGLVYASVGNFDVIVCHLLRDADIQRLRRQSGGSRIIRVTDSRTPTEAETGDFSILPLGE